MAGLGWGRAEPRTVPRRAVGAESEPGIETFPTPPVHPNLAALAAFPGAVQHSAPVAIKVGLGQDGRFADPQPGTPEHNDHAAQPDAFGLSPAPRITAIIS